MSNLSGKTALVTGASRGIGRASALVLAKAGAQVLVHYSTSEKEADAVVAEITKAGGRAEKVGADLRAGGGSAHSGQAGPRDCRRPARHPGGPTPASSKAASIEDTRIEDFDNLFAVNVRAPFSWCATAAGAVHGQQHHLHVFARRPCFGRSAVRLCRDQGCESTRW